MLQTVHCPFTGPPPQSPNCSCQSSRTGPTGLCHLFHQCHKWEIMCLSPSAFQHLSLSPFSRHRQRLHQCPHLPAVGPAVDSPGRTSTPSHSHGYQELTSIVRRLMFQLQALQTEVHRMAAASARIPPSCPCPVGAPTNGAPSHASLPVARLPLAITELLSQELHLVFHLRTVLVVSRQRQLFPLPRTAHQPPFWTASRVCAAVAPHKFRSFVPPVIVTPIAAVVGVSTTAVTAASHNPWRHARLLPSCPPSTTPPRLRVCRAVGCHSSTHSRCRVGSCSKHCRSSRCRATRQPASAQPTCRRPHCSELVQPSCPVGYCNLHCTSPRCPLHDPLSLSGNGQGAARC